MSEMVERVAKAISAAEDGREWYNVHPESWERAARAAILAMREPTYAMIKAGRWAQDHLKWDAMIDAALNEKEPASPVRDQRAQTDEITPQMIEAGIAELVRWEDSDDWRRGNAVTLIYQAMLKLR